MISPSSDTRKRSTPCVAGCWGPTLMTYSSSSKSTLRLRIKLPSEVRLETRSAVLRHLVGHAQRIERRIVILAQRIPHPVVAQEQPPHVGMVQKPDAEIVEHLAFVQARRPSTNRRPRAGRISRGSASASAGRRFRPWRWLRGDRRLRSPLRPSPCPSDCAGNRIPRP